VFQVAAVILASAKVPAQPTVIVVAANKAIGEPQSVIFMSSTLDKAAAITSPELVQLNQDLL
jgi:hypothetical protein